ncbi:MAG TPA: undecaprenyl diphosphate synthase family protein [Methanospirillum sp.]|nr:undecaprenyl diphosphate synthase family protein [Methanospirillum sp.]
MQIAPEHLVNVALWSIEISQDFVRHHPDQEGIASLTFHISTENPQTLAKYYPIIRNIAGFAHLSLHYDDTTENLGTGLPVIVAVGKSGREEIVDAIRNMAEDGVNPLEVDEKKIEQYLTFQHLPDYVIKTGGSHLVDFLIWQSVYSELIFLDLNWPAIRKVDLLRAFRDYQSRARRFGT